MSRHRLDTAELYRHADEKRRQRSWLWKDVARELDLSASTLTRLSQGKRPDADALMTLLIWLDLPTEYVVKPGGKS
jgi:transcriptional regulator with XRE-family HTH domain